MATLPQQHIRVSVSIQVPEVNDSAGRGFDLLRELKGALLVRPNADLSSLQENELGQAIAVEILGGRRNSIESHFQVLRQEGKGRRFTFIGDAVAVTVEARLRGHVLEVLDAIAVAVGGCKGIAEQATETAQQ